MVNVAIAGGTGGVGRTIFEVLSGTSEHKTFILSRKSLSQDHFLTVDYSDIHQLVSILEANDINTIIRKRVIGRETKKTASREKEGQEDLVKYDQRYIQMGERGSLPSIA